MLGKWNLEISWALAVAVVEEDLFTVTSIAFGNISAEIVLLYFSCCYFD